jgi:hypothetical protein
MTNDDVGVVLNSELSFQEIDMRHNSSEANELLAQFTNHSQRHRRTLAATRIAPVTEEDEGDDDTDELAPTPPPLRDRSHREDSTSDMSSINYTFA